MSTEAKTPSAPDHTEPPDPEIEVSVAEPTNGAGHDEDDETAVAEDERTNAKRAAAPAARPPAPRRLAPPPRTRTVAG